MFQDNLGDNAAHNLLVTKQLSKIFLCIWFKKEYIWLLTLVYPELCCLDDFWCVIFDY